MSIRITSEIDRPVRRLVSAQLPEDLAFLLRRSIQIVQEAKRNGRVRFCFRRQGEE